MRAIVTGATGFVGKWLVNELLQQNDDVTVIVRNRERIPEEWKTSLHIIESSLEKISQLTKKDFYGENADIIFHLAWDGTSGPERAETGRQLRNVQYTCDMVKLAKMLNCSRFVNAGSIMEYEAMQYIPADGTVPGMGYIYSTAKLAADFMAKTVAVNSGIEYINVIISNIYGAGEESERFFNTTLKKMMNHDKIPLTHGEQMYDFIYVTDAVKAIILAGKKGEKNTAYYIGNSTQYPLKHFIIQMKEVLESRSELGFGEVPFRGNGLSYNEFDTGRLVHLGFRPEVDFAKGIYLTREWMLKGENGG